MHILATKHLVTLQCGSLLVRIVLINVNIYTDDTGTPPYPKI